MSKATPRRRIVISSSEEEDESGTAGGFLSDDDDDVVEDSVLDVTTGSKSEGSVVGASPASSGNEYLSPLQKSFGNKSHQSHASIVSSTPRSSCGASPMFKFEQDGDVSAILSESLDQVSINKPDLADGDFSSDSGGENENDNDRSRSFREPREKDVGVSPISKKLGNQNDLVSQQKLRERLLRKSVQTHKDAATPKRSSKGGKKPGLVEATLSPILHAHGSNQHVINSSPMSACSVSSKSPNSSAMSVRSGSSGSPAAVEDSVNSSLLSGVDKDESLAENKSARKRLDTSEAFAADAAALRKLFPITPDPADSTGSPAVRTGSTSSLKSLNSAEGADDTTTKSFRTPRKSVVIQLDSSSDEQEEDLDETEPLPGNEVQNDQVSESDVDDEQFEGEEISEEEDENSEGEAVINESGDHHLVTSDSGSPTNIKEAGEDSIVCLSSDENNDESKMILPEHVRRISPGKENRGTRIVKPEQKQAPPLSLQKYINESLESLRHQKAGLEKTMSLVDVARLPDGGANMRQKIASLEEAIRYKSRKPEVEILSSTSSNDSKPAHISSSSSHSGIQILGETGPSTSRGTMPVLGKPQIQVIAAPDFNPEMYNRLLNNDKKRLFGGKMTEERRYDVQRVTEKSLKTMHTAITTVPDESQTIDTPKGLRIELMAHQKQGMAWLTWRETQSPPGGILADDMGLGKTLSMISLVLHQKNERLLRKEEGKDADDKKKREVARANGLYPSNATLVVAPASLIYQWEAEIEKRVKPDRLLVAVFHGPKNKRESDPKRLARHDIVITTFNLLTTELTEKITTAHKGDSDDSDDDSADERDNWGQQAAVGKEKKKKTKISKNSDSVLAKIAWDRIILDEAHQIKNRKSGASKAACRLAGNSRWCLTGTPIHNNLWDFFSLIRFLRVSPFDEERHWKEYIMSGKQKDADRLNLLTKNLLLRRTKTQICSLTNKPLVDLQPKVVTVHDLKLQGLEAQIYDIMFTATQQKVKQMLSEEENAKHEQQFGFYRKKRVEKGQEVVNPFNFGPRTIAEGDRFQQMSCMLVMLLRLRQACVHMYLTKSAVDMDAFESLGGDDKDAVNILEKTLADMSINEEGLDDERAQEASQIFEKDHLSCKVKKLLEIVDDCLERQDKIVIVSQWTSLLDIVEDQLVIRNVRYTSITGKVLPADRQPRVDSFNKEKGGARVMLLSLTAGGVGLNLVGGNHLVMVDLHWNPALEAQACDRIYRMGQKKTVYIHRLVTSGTIEQRVVDLQTKKLELAGAVLEGAASKKMNKLTMADLKYLFDLEPKRAPATPRKVAPPAVPIASSSNANPPYRPPGPSGSHQGY